MSVLFFARDPGAANVITALFRAFGGEKVLYAKDYARKHLVRFSVPFVDFNSSVTPQSDLMQGVASVKAWLSGLEGVTAVVTGTADVDDVTDKQIWQAAHELSIPTIAVIDLAIRTKERFFTKAGELVRPDYVLCPDDTVTKEIAAAQIPRQCAVTIGRPYLSMLHESRELWLAKRDGVRQQISDLFSAKFSTLVVFASEAQRAMLDDGEFAEVKALQLAQQCASEALQDSCFVVKLHPRERWEDFAGANCVSTEIDSLDLIAAADIVIGIKSMLLLEAVLLGRPAVSISAWDLEAPAFVSDSLGLVADAKNSSQLSDWLKTAAYSCPDKRILDEKLFIEPNWKSVLLSVLDEARSGV
ncbi:MAG: hypothetical protein KDD66_05370 [Bdellovibrionales bacterium]|nr:hypothetical protein [Bdellovibrionales bacterium]